MNNKPDIDPQETQEWLDALEAVLENEGVERAHFLLERLIDKARRSGAYLPYSANTAYLNTIPVTRQEHFSGDRAMERRIRSFVRWNSMAMVIQANRLSSELGGHIASFASVATLFDVGYNHFFHARSKDHGGDLIFIQGHSAPGVYGRAYLEGRISEEQLYNFRQEVDGNGLSSYPHPWLMPGFWQFPTVSMGLGPIMAIYQARFMRYLNDRGIVNTSGRRVWAFLGDGEMDEPESLGAISLAARERLDNLTFVVNCNLQRLDGPVRGNGKIIQELEAVFRGAGWNVIKVIWGSYWDPLFARDKQGFLLKRMEEESERFGKAVGLDSASTFECIVDRDRHYFMEVNTRIQVEHRVTELVYSLKFTNPKNKKDFFIVESLVEAMALLAMHKKRLPRPERVARFGAGAEARLNATDCSLSPSAGGYIRYWSPPIEGEIRDDQGICIKNPDTGLFMRYHLAGAYDSNIALLLTKGEDRLDSYEHLAKVLRSTVLRGTNLATNLEFHYGLVNWFLGQNVMAKPTTRFVVPYLTLVGKLKEEANKLDVVFAFLAMKKHFAGIYKDDPEVAKTISETLDRKGTLLTRPMEILLNDPHLLSGWLSINRRNFQQKDGKLLWLRNPLVILEETYEYLYMNWREGAPSAEVIWTHDRDLLQNALSFYAELRAKFGLKKDEYLKLTQLLAKEKPQGGYDKQTWAEIREAHLGYEIGNELFGMLFLIADKTDFFDFKVEDDLEVTIPDYLNDPDLQGKMKKILVP
ncbi:MAG: hypothetical protein P8Y25_09905, partial [Chromatiaceae bacterium]